MRLLTDKVALPNIKHIIQRRGDGVQNVQNFVANVEHFELKLT